MFTTEKAFDALPTVVDLYDKLDIDGYRKKISEENKGKGKKVDVNAIGINLLKYILTNTPKIKEEVFSLVAIFEDKTVEEVKAQNFVKTLKTFKTIFEDKDLMDFFKQAI